MILYLHGFRSSPRSFKARVVGEKMAALGRASELICPQLPASPNEAMALALTLIERYDTSELAIIGSSLGGYYATWLAERLGCRAVLLNPAVYPLKDLDKHVGVTTEYHSDKVFEFKREYIDELGALAVPAITRPERYFLIAATGDEVLDYRDMTAHYAGARQQVIDGSDHALTEFGQYVDEVLAFCLDRAASPAR
ncbi:YqiA/YcfP family alpha/beta fold hydrolase [Massilia antarctica]|uniref:YqiA/YcfP family alpha/beta fold hydrolase n=1 Tax=Massilia antarctica TaxID=2765360 RepID=UPI0006BB69C6|nr:YqiA/YcfP family alpha/beta fold hydrolase [Massilia sp. H27-R4]MCY0913556.1 esterase [Massilia sp. H27-R4]CUI09705.1 Putative esterase, FIGfam005057 [Janthinobacterium sp. CG23_2]CUU33491.1 Putative esterase, FIGfam005057 [Janthinobacterium sp. CG23_2]